MYMAFYNSRVVCNLVTRCCRAVGQCRGLDIDSETNPVRTLVHPKDPKSFTELDYALYHSSLHALESAKDLEKVWTGHLEVLEAAKGLADVSLFTETSQRLINDIQVQLR
jgi:hypothetical protein